MGKGAKTSTLLKEVAATKAQAAGTAIKLKQALPIMEPVPISSSVINTPIRLANNSGTEAPRAISVDPAISGGKSQTAYGYHREHIEII